MKRSTSHVRHVRPGPEVAEPGPSAAAADQVRLIAVDERSEGQRLDNFLGRECRGVPRSHLYRVIRDGQVRVNGGRAKANTRLALGDAVRIPPIRISESSVGSLSVGVRAQRGSRLPVLHEDDSLLVIDKPAGVAVHGGSGIDAGAVEMLRAARPELRFLELVHRLDRETSGVLVLAKRRAALLDLHAQLRERVTDKRYLAIAVGRMPRRTRALAAPLRRYLSAEGERRVLVDPIAGQEAMTRVIGCGSREVEGLGEFSRVECKIETGRTHQIRVHLANDGHPVAGDDKYGDFPLNRALARIGFARMFLHAASMTIRHPDSGTLLRLLAPIPEVFERLVPGDTDEHDGAHFAALPGRKNQ